MIYKEGETCSFPFFIISKNAFRVILFKKVTKVTIIPLFIIVTFFILVTTASYQ